MITAKRELTIDSEKLTYHRLMKELRNQAVGKTLSNFRLTNSLVTRVPTKAMIMVYTKNGWLADLRKFCGYQLGENVLIADNAFISKHAKQ